MLVNILFNLLLFIVIVNSIKIPFINNTILKPTFSSNSIIIQNHTCKQCLCMLNSSYIALNCFPNNTCQFFYTFPNTYQIQTIPTARLYFPKQIYPNASQCCMPDTQSLLNKLNTAIPTYASVPSPRCLILDNHGYLVTVSQTNNSLVRFYSTNLTIVSQPPSPNFPDSPLNLAFYNDAYYVGFEYFILVIDSNNFTLLHNITTSSLSGTRDMIFLNNGQMMVVASTDNAFLLFFNRSNIVSTNYTFVYQQSVSYTNPHGLWYINDTSFYVTSWGNNAIYSYSAKKNSTLWTEKLLLNAGPIAPSPYGSHLTIDGCKRYWFSLGTYDVLIFDSYGLFLGNITQTNYTVFHAIIANNYVVYLSDNQFNRIIRIDPNIQC
ncbi:unnamed protein product [Adineta steineri]|uniref:Transmembrane protein n=1 Tax=Adineta steineri TaxID=433720 RepID=A0A814J6M0_9BILA|nr:unnamed protein product [Adineta steineri]CAF1077289.1 unnamed protein product [Adineta steineri]